MKTIAKIGREDLAMVYICEMAGGQLLECAESVQPPRQRSEKWVLLISVMYGCSIGCAMCDAGQSYHGKLRGEEILEQIEFLVQTRFPDMRVPSEQFKIQFSRMGEPSLNEGVLDVLRELSSRFEAPGLMPSISTIAPNGTEKFFEQLLEIRHERYAEVAFQFQFSLHSTDLGMRKDIIPVKTWSFKQMAAYGERFYVKGGCKIALNFALSRNATINPAVLLEHFSPETFLIKVTPINPTYTALKNGLSSYLDPEKRYADNEPFGSLRAAGYEVIVSIGNTEENLIGSNCGQFLQTYLASGRKLDGGYSYHVYNT